jgi:hypothetical protein
MRLNAWRQAVVVGAVALTAIVVTAQFAGGTTRADGGSTTKVTVVREAEEARTSSVDWVDLPGATVPGMIPANAPAGSTLYLVTFSAESACSGTGFCAVQILIGGREAEPADDGDFAFDSSDAGRETSQSWEGHSMQRSLCIAANGLPHDATTRVQFSTTPTTMFRLDDWHLTVEAITSAGQACAPAPTPTPTSTRPPLPTP